MLLVELDVPEWLVGQGWEVTVMEVDRAVGDLVFIAFYYLPRIGEYTIKGSQNETKQMVQFKLGDVTFFNKNRDGKLRCLPRNALDHLIMMVDGATLKIDNKKMDGKGCAFFMKQTATGQTALCRI